MIMKPSELVKGIDSCPCGKSHKCPIDFVKIGKNATDALPTLCEGYSSILLVSDENTYKACAGRVEALISEKIQKSLVLSSNADVVIPNEEKISEIESMLTDKTDLIIGVGSGVINDLCKYVSHKNALPYYIVATAPSMD